MTFDIDEVIREMIAAIAGVVQEDEGDISGYAKEIMEKEKETLAELSDLRLQGEIDDEEFQSEIEDEKETIAAELKAVVVMEKAMVQKAVNAAIDVLIKAVGMAVSAAL